MAVLEINEIIQIIKAGKPSFMREAQKKQKILNVHVNGRNVTEYLSKVDGFENESQYTLRKKFAISNKFVFANLLRPVDKVFTAKGGSRIYRLKGGEKTESEFRNKLTNIRYGMSVRKWIEKVQANKYYSDPAGMVFCEVSKNGEDAFPTIKSIQKIRNYETEGRSVEWVCFEGEKRKNDKGEELPGDFFRFVDDAKDYIFHKDGEDVKQLEDETFDVVWGRVPAVINSDILNDELKYSDSPVDPVVELADKYLRTNTIKSIHEFLHGFPFFWMYQKKCETCKGTGEINGHECPDCKGTGRSLKRDVSDVLLLNPPKNKDAPTIAPDVAGYVVPPLEIPKEQREELGWVWTAMHFTQWGTSYTPGDRGETATGRFLDVMPVNDRLGQFSDAFEDMESKIIDFIGEFYFPDAYEGNSISYGRRYLMEAPDEVWKKYLDAKQKGAPKSSLSHLLNQYYQSEFMNDIEMLNVMLKGMKIEPFVHNTIDQIRGFVDSATIRRKTYFGEWWVNLSEQYVLTTDLKRMRKDLDKWIDENYEESEPEPEPTNE